MRAHTVTGAIKFAVVGDAHIAAPLSATPRSPRLLTTKNYFPAAKRVLLWIFRSEILFI